MNIISQSIRETFLKFYENNPNVSNNVRDILLDSELRMCGFHNNELGNLQCTTITSSLSFPQQLYMSGSTTYSEDIYTNYIKMLLMSGHFDSIKEKISMYMSFPTENKCTNIVSSRSNNSGNNQINNEKLTQSYLNNNFTVSGLRNLCTRNNIYLKSNMKKDDIVDAILENKPNIKL